MLSRVARESRAYPSSVLPLRKLHTVETHQRGGFEFLRSFMDLPSLRTVRAVGQSRRNNRQCMTLSLPATSNIVVVDLDGCSFNANQLDTFLSRISNLRVFRFRDTRVDTGSWSYPSWNPRQIVECLLRYASHSLSSLSITGDRTSYHRDRECLGPSCNAYIGSLRGFGALRYITVDVFMLMDHLGSHSIDIHNHDNDNILDADVDDGDALGSEDEDDCLSGTLSTLAWYLEVSEHTQIVHRLINVLPASAETLTLEMAADKNIMQQMLRRLPERKAERLPQLKEISYQCEECCVLDIEKACESVGVKVTQVFKYGNIKNMRRDSLDSEALIGDWGGWRSQDPSDYNSYYSR